MVNEQEVTQLAGILGYPLGHSLSPAIHNAAFAHLGLDWHYVPLMVEEPALGPLLSALRLSNFRGLNVTMPYKTTVIPHLDIIDPLVELAGACNTIKVDAGRLSGYNTDAGAFMRSLRQEAGFSPQGKVGVLIGAGGAARAAAAVLAQGGLAALHIVNRTRKTSEELREALISAFPALDVGLRDRNHQLKDVFEGADIVVNATPVGMHPDEDQVPVAPELLQERHVVADLIYRPATTLLLREAEKVGARTVSGVHTFLYQAAYAFEIWTGRAAPVEVMLQVLRAELGLQTTERHAGGAANPSPGREDR